MKQIEIIHHIRGNTENNFGGMTVYATHNSGDSFVKIATSQCSWSDQYNRRLGAKMAKSNYAGSQYIKVLIPAESRHNVTHKELREYIVSMFY